MTPVEMLVMFVKNFWEESGMVGVGIGFYGFVLPYFQKNNTKTNIKAGIMTGLLLGILFFVIVRPAFLFALCCAAYSV